MNLKALHIAWQRSAALFHSAHQELEEELQRMKQKNSVPQDIIDRKDLCIENLVEFYNQTDELITAYKLSLANSKIENHFLTELLLKKVTLDDVMQYKPSLAVRLYNKETGEDITVSSIKEADGKD